MEYLNVKCWECDPRKHKETNFRRRKPEPSNLELGERVELRDPVELCKRGVLPQGVSALPSHDEC